MANHKQDGSNLINIEYSTGKCGTQCEQCFVNYGQQGMATCLNWSAPGFEKPRQYAAAEARKYARSHPGHEIYNPGLAPDPSQVLLPAAGKYRAVTKLPKDFQMLRWAIPSKGKPGFWQIPVKVAREPWVVKKHRARCYMFDEVEGIEQLGVMPIFLRVSSMSDSSRAPAEWIRQVREAWGDHCFFNSAIRTIDWAMHHPVQRAVLDEYHKLVVTTNSGQQRPPLFMPRTVRVKPAGRGASKARVEKGKSLRYRVEKRRQRWIATHDQVRGSMLGEAGQIKPFDFFHPKTLSEIGLGHLESIIKFYRVRAFPTMRPVVNTDAPVVVTQMRFKGFENLAEFARRYALKLEFHVPSWKMNKTGAREPNSKVFPAGLKQHFFDVFTWVEDEQATRTEAWISDPEGRYPNASPHAGEPSRFVYESSFFRPIDLHYFDEEPYVCDRLRGGCAFCGLCASLDAQGPTIDGIPYCNELNRVSQGLLAPLPGGRNAGYIGVLSQRGVEVRFDDGKKVEVIPGDFFATHMRALGYTLDTPVVFEGWQANPAERPPLHPDECAAMFADVAAYLEKGAYGTEEYFCEGWNTHENAAATCGFAVWSLMVHAKLAHMSREQAEEWILGIMYDATNNIDVLAGADELWDMWDDYTAANDQFGPTSPELLGL